MSNFSVIADRCTISRQRPLYVDCDSQFRQNDAWGPRRTLAPVGLVSAMETRGIVPTHDGGGVIDYVFAPPELRGTGAAGRLMEGVVADVRSRNLKITPLCGYAVAWLKRHSEAADLLT